MRQQLRGQTMERSEASVGVPDGLEESVVRGAGNGEGLCGKVQRFLGECRFDHVQVSIEGGMLTLRGWVESEFERQLAAGHIRRLTGLAMINSQLTVQRRVDPKSLGFFNRLGKWGSQRRVS